MKRYLMYFCVMLSLAACSSDDKSESNVCGAGDVVESDGESFCYYNSALIIEGFDCPPEMPHRFDQPGGNVLCSPRQDLDEMDLDTIIDIWRLRENYNNVNNINNVNNVNNINNTNNATNNAGGECPMDVAVGDQTLVIDWECPVKECCGGGVVIADCGSMGGDYLC